MTVDLHEKMQLLVNLTRNNDQTDEYADTRLSCFVTSITKSYLRIQKNNSASSTYVFEDNESFKHLQYVSRCVCTKRAEAAF